MNGGMIPAAALARQAWAGLYRNAIDAAVNPAGHRRRAGEEHFRLGQKAQPREKPRRRRAAHMPRPAIAADAKQRCDRQHQAVGRAVIVGSEEVVLGEHGAIAQPKDAQEEYDGDRSGEAVGHRQYQPIEQDRRRDENHEVGNQDRLHSRPKEPHPEPVGAHGQWAEPVVQILIKYLAL